MNNTRTLAKALAVAAGMVVAGSALGAPGTGSDNKNFNLQLTLLKPLILFHDSDLDFGTAYAGAAQPLSVAPSDAAAATFRMTGEENALVNVSLSASVTMSNGVSSITVDNFSVESSHDTGTDAFVTSGVTKIDGVDGETDIRVGATANIEADDTAGVYTGSNTLTVAYQ